MNAAVFCGVRMNRDDKMYDIGLVANYLAKNYGAHFTQFALFATLKEFGFSVLMIERPNDAPASVQMQTPVLFENIPYPPGVFAKLYPNLEEMKELNTFCKVFVTGSDQLFNNNLYRGYNRFMCQGYVADNRYKMSYAASFGHDHIWGSVEDTMEETFYLKRFHAFSVREDSGVRVCKKYFGIRAEHVLDPVFLCPMPIYERMVEYGSKYIPRKNYLFAYILDTSKKKEKVLRYCADKYHLEEIRAISDAVKPKNEQTDLWSINTLTDAKCEAWLAHIAKSSFYITDSFHGMCFAILFKKDFLVIVNKDRGETRFTSVAKALGLEDRLCYDFQDLEDRLNTVSAIDYDAVFNRLEKEQERCKNYLRTQVMEGLQFYKEGPLLFKETSCWEDYKKREEKKTYIRRKIQGGIRCLREHGFFYTVRRFFEKFINKRKETS